MESTTTLKADYDAERGFLSCTRDEEGYDIWAYGIEQRVGPEHFTNKSLQEYFMSMQVADREDDFGMIGAMIRMPADWKDNNHGFVGNVLMCCDTPSQGKRFVDRLVKAEKFRRIQAIANRMNMEVADSGKLDSPDPIASKGEEELTAIIEPNEASLVSAKELAQATHDAIKREKEQGGATIQTHLPFLNKILDGGFRAGQMVVIAARPSIGKTTLAMNFAYHSSTKGRKNLVFSLEMGKDQLGKKLAAIAKGVNLSRFAERSETKDDERLMREGLELVSELPLWVDDDPSQTISKIRATAKILNRRNDIDAIYIDYLGLMETEGKHSNREQEVATISKACKKLAKELNAVVFLVCQLNRESAKSGGPPQLHNLRESGQIEQDADIVMMIHRDLKPGGDAAVADIIVAKNRFGPVGHTNERVVFERQTQRFTEREVPRKPKLNDGPQVRMPYTENRI